MPDRISLCMIVKDEAANLRRCLASVIGAVDEIVVVDTGSADESPRVAAEFGAKVFSLPWQGSFSAARNAALDLAGGEWILVLDADEELTLGGREALRRVRAERAHEGYFVKIINYLGREEWEETCPDLVFRLFRNRPEYRFRGTVHEQIADVIREKKADASYGTAEDLVIRHYGYLDRQIAEKDKKNRNLRLIYRELLANPQDRLLRYHYGVELYRSGQFQAAAAQLGKAAEGLDRRTIYLPKLLRYLALAYYGAGQPGAALAILHQGTELFPDYADLYYYAGLICREQKKYAAARKYFRQALATPEQPTHYASFAGVRGFRAHYQLGQVAEEFFDHETALREYLAGLRENPSFAPAFAAIVRLLDPYRDPEYAQACLEKVCEFCTPQAALWAGRLLFQASAYRLALGYLERSALSPEMPTEFALWKAICLAQNRRFEEARRILAGFPPGHPLYLEALWHDFFYRWWRQERETRSLAKKLLAARPPVAMRTLLDLLLSVWPGKTRKTRRFARKRGPCSWRSWPGYWISGEKRRPKKYWPGWRRRPCGTWRGRWGSSSGGTVTSRRQRYISVVIWKTIRNRPPPVSLWPRSSGNGGTGWPRKGSTGRPSSWNRANHVTGSPWPGFTKRSVGTCRKRRGNGFRPRPRRKKPNEGRFD
ncbi:MAG: tetratricopeptide repeat-containing glycosyltransferase family 2 protein [Bacillota bacterium]